MISARAIIAKLRQTQPLTKSELNWFAKGLSETMNIPWSESFLIRTENTETQTKKSRTDRFENVQSAFKVAMPDKIKDTLLFLNDIVFANFS